MCSNAYRTAAIADPPVVAHVLATCPQVVPSPVLEPKDKIKEPLGISPDSFKIAVAGQYRPVSEAIHGYDERVDVESICRITKSIALFVAEWCGVAEAR